MNRKVTTEDSAEGASVVFPQISESHIYALSGFSIDAEEGIENEDLFSRTVVDSPKGAMSAPLFYSAVACPDDDVTSLDLQLVRGVARIDINNIDPRLNINQIVVSDAPGSTYLFPSEEGACESTAVSYTRSYPAGMPASEKGVFTLFESDRPVNIIVKGTMGRKAKTINLSLPEVVRNKVYTVTFSKDDPVEVHPVITVADWDDEYCGTGPENNRGIHLDLKHSILPAGVRYDETTGIIHVPYTGAEDMVIALRSDIRVDVDTVMLRGVDMDIEAAYPSGGGGDDSEVIAFWWYDEDNDEWIWTVWGDEGGDEEPVEPRYTYEGVSIREQDNGIVTSYKFNIIEQVLGKNEYTMDICLRKASHVSVYDRVRIVVDPNPKYIRTVHTLPAIGLMTLFAACENDILLFDGVEHDKSGLTFIISAPVEQEQWLSRSGGGYTEPTKLVSLRYLLADAEGKILDHHYSKLNENLDTLNIDGLNPGKYSLLFLGSSEESAFAEIDEPKSLDDTWISCTADNQPVNGVYFYKKIDFTVDLEPKYSEQKIVLERPMAKVAIDIPALPKAVEDLISSVNITVDGTDFYSCMKADGTYDGYSAVKNYEMCDSLLTLKFYTFPSQEPISGTVKVKAATMLGDSITTSYRFENLKTEAGKVTTVSLNLQHPDMQTGFMLVRPQDYYDYDADLMMMEDEPCSVLHDGKHRRFNVIYPLVISTWEKNMRIRLFEPGSVDDVDIYADIPSLGLDSVKMGRIEHVEPFLDMLVPVPFTERDAHYYDVRGKRVTIPKMNKIPADIKWYYKTPDPYLAQLAALKFDRWQAWNPYYGAHWAGDPDPNFVRYAFTHNQNLAIMYDSPEFYEMLWAHDGEYIDQGRNVPCSEIVPRIYGVDGFGWGWTDTYAGMGGGSVICLSYDAVSFGMYPGDGELVYMGYFFHEFGHCLGYSHDGNMCYGPLWNQVCENALMACFRNGKIRFGYSDVVNNLPYKRADAPKWAKPRFVESN